VTIKKSTERVQGTNSSKESNSFCVSRVEDGLQLLYCAMQERVSMG
jgi:hypothetical protein